MSKETILNYLEMLENGALNYYQTIEIIRIAGQNIQNYIEQLEEQNENQKEVINKVNKYIEKHSFFVNDTWYNKKIGYPKDTFNAQEVLDMLKEVSE